MKKKLTIFTCAYNQPELVVRAMDSVPRRADIEYIVIDDGSTDNTWDVIRRYQDAHPDLEMSTIRNEENHGLGYCKNMAFCFATGEYIHELDHDDFLYKPAYLKALEELDGTDIVYINLRTNSGKIMELSPASKFSFVAGTSKFYRRAFIGNTRTREDVWNEDWSFFNTLNAKPHTEKFTGLTAYHYNFPREGSMYWEATHGKNV